MNHFTWKRATRLPGKKVIICCDMILNMHDRNPADTHAFLNIYIYSTTWFVGSAVFVSFNADLRRKKGVLRVIILRNEQYRETERIRVYCDYLEHIVAQQLLRVVTLLRWG